MSPWAEVRRADRAAAAEQARDDASDLLALSGSTLTEANQPGLFGGGS